MTLNKTQKSHGRDECPGRHQCLGMTKNQIQGIGASLYMESIFERRDLRLNSWANILRLSCTHRREIPKLFAKKIIRHPDSPFVSHLFKLSSTRQPDPMWEMILELSLFHGVTFPHSHNNGGACIWWGWEGHRWGRRNLEQKEDRIWCSNVGIKLFVLAIARSWPYAFAGNGIISSHGINHTEQFYY